MFLFVFWYEIGFPQNNYPEIWNALMNITQWENVKKTEKYELYKYQFKEYSISALKIEMLLDADPQSVLDVAWDVSSYPNILPSAFIIDAGVITKIDSIQTAWQIIDIPFITPRIYCFEHIRTKKSVNWYKINLVQKFNNKFIIPLLNVGSWKVSKINGLASAFNAVSIINVFSILLQLEN